MNGVFMKKVCLFLLLVIFLSTAININCASAEPSVEEHGMLEGTENGASSVGFILDLSNIPSGYGVKIISDLESVSLIPKNHANSSINKNTLLLYPPIKQNIVQIEINGTTPKAYTLDTYNGLQFIALNTNEYYYYHVIAIDKNGVEYTDIMEKKKGFKLTPPEDYTTTQRELDSIENDQLKNIAEKLFNAGSLELVNDIKDVDLNMNSDNGNEVTLVIVLLICSLVFNIVMWKKMNDMRQEEEV